MQVSTVVADGPSANIKSSKLSLFIYSIIQIVSKQLYSDNRKMIQ